MSDGPQSPEVSAPNAQEFRSAGKLPRFVGEITKRFSPHERMRATEAEVARHIDFFKSEYSLEIDLSGKSPEDEDISFIRPLNINEAKNALEVLRQEIIKYPPEFIRYCDIKALRLVKGVRLSEHPRFPTPDILVGGLAHPYTRLMYISTFDGYKKASNTFHHEILHMSDHARARRSYRGFEDGVQDLDREWANLAGGPRVYLRNNYEYLQRDEPKRPAGFAEKFGKADEHEDRATVATLIQTNLALARQLSAADKVLDKKIRKVMTDYWIRSAGYMDATYFEDLEKGRVTESYFKNRVYN